MRKVFIVFFGGTSFLFSEVCLSQHRSDASFHSYRPAAQENNINSRTPTNPTEHTTCNGEYGPKLTISETEQLLAQLSEVAARGVLTPSAFKHYADTLKAAKETPLHPPELNNRKEPDIRYYSKGVSNHPFFPENYGHPPHEGNQTRLYLLMFEKLGKHAPGTGGNHPDPEGKLEHELRNLFRWYVAERFPRNNLSDDLKIKSEIQRVIENPNGVRGSDLSEILSKIGTNGYADSLGAFLRRMTRGPISMDQAILLYMICRYPLHFRLSYVRSTGVLRNISGVSEFGWPLHDNEACWELHDRLSPSFELNKSIHAAIQAEQEKRGGAFDGAFAKWERGPAGSGTEILHWMAKQIHEQPSLRFVPVLGQLINIADRIVDVSSGRRAEGTNSNAWDVAKLIGDSLLLSLTIAAPTHAGIITPSAGLASAAEKVRGAIRTILIDAPVAGARETLIRMRNLASCVVNKSKSIHFLPEHFRNSSRRNTDILPGYSEWASRQANFVLEDLEKGKTLESILNFLGGTRQGFQIAASGYGGNFGVRRTGPARSLLGAMGGSQGMSNVLASNALNNEIVQLARNRVIARPGRSSRSANTYTSSNGISVEAGWLETGVLHDPLGLWAIHPSRNQIRAILDDCWNLVRQAEIVPSLAEKQRKLAHAIYGYYLACPFQRGSASVGDVFWRALGSRILNRRINLPDGVDMRAMVMSQDDFIDWLSRRL